MKKLSRRLAVWAITLVLAIGCSAAAVNASESATDAAVSGAIYADNGNASVQTRGIPAASVTITSISPGVITVSLNSALASVETVHVETVIWINGQHTIWEEHFYPRAGMYSFARSRTYPTGWSYATMFADCTLLDGTKGVMVPVDFQNPWR